MESKICIKCKKEKPKTKEFWYERNIGTNIFKNTCKECCKEKAKERYTPRNKPITREGFKICTTCNQELPATLEFFNREKRSKDGITGRCRACRLKEQKEYRDKNKDNPIFKKKNVEHSKAYKKANKEKVNAYVKKYYELNYKGTKSKREYKHNYYKEKYANNEEYKKHKKQYNEENKERDANFKREWCKNNREKCKISHQKSRARKMKLPRTLTSQQWESIKVKFKNKCAYCGRELKLEQEHFVALSKGGEYTHNNIIPSCKSCNVSKHNYNFFEWYPKYKYYSKEREAFILEYLGYKKDIQQLKII